MILHITTGAALEAARRDGALRPPSLASAGFVHLSLGRQWRRPLEALFAGTPDLVLLGVDETAFDAPLRYEAGDPDDPDGERFPHLYGPLPLAAVRTVEPVPTGCATRTRPLPSAVARLAAAAAGPEAGAPVRWRRRGFTVTDDRDALDRDVAWELLRTQYWVGDRDRDTFDASVDGSVTLALLDREGATVGMARVVSDAATFAWLCDVVVDPALRGSGHGTHLVRCALDHPALGGVRAWYLRTRDAQGVYARFGFGPGPADGRWMHWPG